MCSGKPMYTRHHHDASGIFLCKRKSTHLSRHKVFISCCRHNKSCLKKSLALHKSLSLGYLLSQSNGLLWGQLEVQSYFSSQFIVLSLQSLAGKFLDHSEYYWPCVLDMNSVLAVTPSCTRITLQEKTKPPKQNHNKQKPTTHFLLT